MARQRALAPPTLDYIENLRTELDDLYRTQNETILRMRKVRELQQAVPLDDALRLVGVEVRDPTATDEIARVSATLSVNPFKVKCEPSSLSDKAQINSTRREKWTEELLHVAGTKVPGVDAFSMGIDSQVGDGGCWCMVLYNKDLWSERFRVTPGQFNDEIEEYEEEGETRTRIKRSAEDQYNAETEEAKKRAGPPFVWVPLDTVSVQPAYRGTDLAEVLIVEEVPRSSSFRQYRLKEDENGNIVPDELGQGSSQKGATTVTRLTHWDQHFCTVAFVCNGKPASTGRVIQQWRHKYGRPPIFYAPGLLMGHWRNRKVGWSVAEAKRWLVEYRSYLWTLHAQVAARDALTPVVDEVGPDVAGAIVGQNPAAQQAGDKTNVWNLREIVRLKPGHTLKPMQFPQVADSLREQIAMVSDAIAKLETPRVTSEIGAGLEGAGFAINQVLSEAKVRHNPLVASYQRMMEEIVKFIWRYVRDVLKEKVWVYAQGEEGWLGMGADELKDTVRVRVELDPERPSAKLVESRYYHERVKAGTLSEDQAVDRMGDNPDEVRIGKAIDRMRKTPWYTKMQDQQVLEELGLGDTIEEEANQIAQSGVLPGMQAGGVPGMMGSEIVPDMGNLAAAPNGAGAAPMGGQMGAPGEMGMGTPVPTQSAAPLAQAIVG